MSSSTASAFDHPADEQLEDQHIVTIVQKAVSTTYAETNIALSDKSVRYIAENADGDARKAINTIEKLFQHLTHMDRAALEREIAASRGPDEPARLGDAVCVPLVLVQKELTKTYQYDKKGEEHYNVISAFHKSLRAWRRRLTRRAPTRTPRSTGSSGCLRRARTRSTSSGG